jgi:hypothetical protein
MTVLLGNESLQQFSLQRLVPEHHPHATATPWLSPNACRRGTFDDLELESPPLAEEMRPSPLAIRASACWNSGFRKTFGYPRQAPY